MSQNVLPGRRGAAAPSCFPGKLQRLARLANQPDIAWSRVTSLGPSIAGFNFPAIDLVAATILSLSYIIKVNLREGGS